MILLDTHILIWWIDNSPRLTQRHRQIIQERQDDGLCISIYSCWEIAKLVEYGKLELKFSIEDWLEIALSHPNLRSIYLTIPTIIKSTQLPGFHKDPADQIIVATSIILAIPLLTADEKIIAYPDVTTLG
ncbi:type II toxin-antitoxin system VapC family toxin [Chamaesiphon sp.]|uniref:type II toxin-antitoxin system VapC family toxin n=1 Tax=Chamaesiphon sp. TaxID=2814140 RepID=UPI0035948037